MHQVITIGSALVDIFIHSPQFVPTKSKRGDLLCQLYGDKTEVDGFNVFTGGGGSNTAAGFARLGFKTAIMCETGRDGFARLVMQDFQDQQVSTQLVVEEKKEQTGMVALMKLLNQYKGNPEKLIQTLKIIDAGVTQ